LKNGSIDWNLIKIRNLIESCHGRFL
jgi:hypothetical protein